jgi:hypothetical protein
MSWPPKIGEPVPRADEAFGVREKLADYCLNPDHDDGGPKAEGFRRILGIEPADVEYLMSSLLAGLRDQRVSEVRENGPFGVLCEVLMPVSGLRERADRVFDVVTSWEIRDQASPPRLVTAYISG